MRVDGTGSDKGHLHVPTFANDIRVDPSPAFGKQIYSEGSVGLTAETVPGGCQELSCGPYDLYTCYSEWWPLLSPVSNYKEEAGLYADVISSRASEARTILELGSGGGNNAFHLKKHYTMTLVDRSAEMLAVSRRLNPECRHVRGDMRSVRLPSLFDVVFIHDAIMYLIDEEDLRRTFDTASSHLPAGGLLIIVPDCFRETFVPSTKHGGSDSGDRGMRYLQWTHDPDPQDNTYTVSFSYMFMDPDGQVSFDHEQHTFGLFSSNRWLELLESTGFDAEVVPLNLSDLEPGSFNAIAARKR